MNGEPWGLDLLPADLKFTFGTVFQNALLALTVIRQGVKIGE